MLPSISSYGPGSSWFQLSVDLVTSTSLATHDLPMSTSVNAIQARRHAMTASDCAILPDSQGRLGLAAKLLIKVLLLLLSKLLFLPLLCLNVRSDSS